MLPWILRGAPMTYKIFQGNFSSLQVFAFSDFSLPSWIQENEYIQKIHRIIAAIQGPIMQVTHDIMLSGAIFISSALITSHFTQERFSLLLWNGTLVGIATFLISRLALRMLGLESSSLQWISSTILAMGLFNIQSLIHECGHVFAGMVFLQRPRIIIKIIPFFGGSTKFVPMIASEAWKCLKTQCIFLAIVACGPLTALSFSFLLLRWGMKTLGFYPGIGRIAACAAIIDILFHFRASISALHISPIALQHDFVAIRTLAGIHPLICASVIAGLAVFFVYKASIQREECRSPS